MQKPGPIPDLLVPKLGMGPAACIIANHPPPPTLLPR